MIRKVITTLGIVLLAIGMLSCDDSSTTSGPGFAAKESQVALTVATDGVTMYTVTMDKEVALADGVKDATALAAKVTLTHTLANGNAATAPNPAVTTATIDSGDKTKIALVFDTINFAVGDKLKIAIAANSIADTTADKVKNAAISVEVEVVAAAASGPQFAETQVALTAANGVTSYTVTLDKEVAVVSGKALKDEITLTHTPATGTAATPNPNVTDTTINGATIALTFAQTDLAAGDTLTIDIAAGAIEDTTDATTKNAAISVPIVVEAGV